MIPDTAVRIQGKIHNLFAALRQNELLFSFSTVTLSFSAANNDLIIVVGPIFLKTHLCYEFPTVRLHLTYINKNA